MHKATELTAWDCPHQVDYLSAPPIPGNSDEECSEFTNAISEALSGELPYLTRHDLDPSLPSPEKAVIPYNSLAWVLRDGYPWMPVYVCDPAILKPTLTNLGTRVIYTCLSMFEASHSCDDLGNAHAQYLETATQRATNFRLVYYFGKHEFGLHRAKGVFRTWLGPDHDYLVKGLPRSIFINKHGRQWRSRNDFMFNIFDAAMLEVKSHRMLPQLVASDFTTSRVPLTILPTRRSNNNDDDVDAPARQSHSDDDSYSNESASDQGVDVDSDDQQDVANHGSMYGVMAWSQRSPTLWMPAYVCDPFKLRSTLELLEEASTRLPPGFTPSDMRLVARDPQASSDDEGATSAAAHTTAVAPKAARSLDVDTRSSRSPKRRKSTRNHLPASPPPVTTKPRTVPSQSRPPPPAKKRARSPSPTENNSNQPTRASFDPKDSAVAIGPGFTQPMRHGGVMQTSNSYVRHTPPSKRPTEPDRPAPVAPAVKEVRITETAIKDIPLDSMAWARRSDTLSASSPWWPVYVCDPERLQPTLEHLGNRHQKLLVTAKQYPNSLRLVYLFGGTPDVCAKNMARWRGPDHDLLLKGHPAHAMTGRVVREFARAVRDATKYAATDAYTRLLPDMAESDMVPRYIPPQVPPYSVAWAKSGGDDAPWLPVYICDHNALDPSKHDLVNDRLMSIVKANPEHYRIAYFFGTRHLYEHILHVIQKTLMGGCCAFLKRDPRQRLLPYMVPTDMNLALPAPEKYAIPLNQMVWALSDAYPWLPAFVCDPEHLPCDLRALGAYGDVVPALHKTRGSIKLWECSEYEALIKGHAESMVLADDAWDEFAKAMSNAADFMANDPADRVLPGFEPTNTSRTDEPDAIDLTSSPEATPPSGRRREVASGKRHACRPRQDESAPSDRDDTATDQELEGELSVNSKVMRNKRSISQHAETKKAADDFKYNPTQRQVLQGLCMIEWHGLSCSCVR
ncbi:hypothetical protein B5M09_008846 [Aphanomyces astaci]|uniref:PWWP domain-containing protein n=1 Tax=Aphanomyces astaci TaxID=112090 RepID=A0A425CZ68_APHAT|nr:hypothetical protein B5M09_008846 [Aphanomyces astaci]